MCKFGSVDSPVVNNITISQQHCVLATCIKAASSEHHTNIVLNSSCELLGLSFYNISFC